MSEVALPNSSPAQTYPVEGRRWLVLLVYSLVSLVVQLQWLTFAPVAREAAVAYGVTPFEIDLLSLIFMGVFVVTCIPASVVLDRFGLRVGVGLGASLLAVFGLLKGFSGGSYEVVALAQVGLAMAQPLVTNAVTKVAAQWFPLRERATAVGLATLAQFLGIIVVMLVTPALVEHGPDGKGYDLQPMLLIWGVTSAAAGLLLLAFLRERPASAPGPEAAGERLMTRDGLRHLLAQREMRLVLGLYVIGLGVFNALSTCIDQLCARSGLDVDETGLVGGVMFIAGILGAAVLPPLSDRMRRRKPFLVLAMAVSVPALLALTLADAFVPLVVASAILGFFLLGAGAPIGFQYAAEVSYPTAESMSQGVILLVGQVSGIALIVAINSVGIAPLMWVFVGLAVLATVIALALGESPRILTPEAPASR